MPSPQKKPLLLMPKQISPLHLANKFRGDDIGVGRHERLTWNTRYLCVFCVKGALEALVPASPRALSNREIELC